MNEFLDKYVKIPAAQRWFLFIVLLGIIVCGVYFMAIAPLQKNIKIQRAEVQRIEQEINTLAEKKRKRQELLRSIAALQVDLVRVQTQLPDSSQIPNLLQQIHDQARTAGLQIDRFERNAEIPQAHYVEIPVKMNLSGTYDQLANFLYYVGRLTRIVNVRDINIASITSDLTKPDELGQLKVTALGTTFRYKAAQPQAPTTPGGQP